MYTKQDVFDWLRKDHGEEWVKTRPHTTVPMFVCENGFKVSIQASYYHYCEPQETGLDEYTKVELGFPNRIPPQYILDYIDSVDDDPLETVYCFVPTELVVQMLNEMGVNNG